MGYDTQPLIPSFALCVLRVQVLLLTTVMVIIIVAQAICKPFAFARVHRLQLLVNGCVCLTAFVSLSFFRWVVCGCVGGSAGGGVMTTGGLCEAAGQWMCVSVILLVGSDGFKES